MKFDWPLATNNFSLLDRLKICTFFLNKNNRWTQDKYVREYEKKVADYIGARYAVFVSSGSTANQLIVQEIKDRLVRSGAWPQKNKVVLNAVTWQTNVSPWIREGFEPIFVDVNLDDFCLNYDKLEEILLKEKRKVACVFPTAVLGFTPNMERLQMIARQYQVEIALDACENFFGAYNPKNICAHFTSSTSCFIAHHITTGQEGGFIFTNDKDKYEYYLLSRAHGLLRNLTPYGLEKQRNGLVDPQFDFQTLSSNYRGSDIAAFCGLLDFKRADKYRRTRWNLYYDFKRTLNKTKYYLPAPRVKTDDTAFCLPIICHDYGRKEGVKLYLDRHKIERRSFISGNMLRQLPYQKYGNYKDFPNAEFLNNNAIYIGLHMEVTKKMVDKLVKDLNQL